MAFLVKDVEQKLGLLLVLLFIFTLSIFVVINSPWLYELSIRYLHLTAVTHLSSGELMRCYFSMIRYLQVPWDDKLNLIYFRSSPRGLIHFRDVRRLIWVNNAVLLLSGWGSCMYFKFLGRSQSYWRLLVPFKITATFAIIMVTMILVNFQSAFVIFHRLLFRNKDWIFTKVANPVILALPNDYFLACFLTIVVINLGLLFLGIAWVRNYIR